MSRAHQDKNQMTSPKNQQMGFSAEGEPQLAVDGFQQILDMLRVADPVFRESLLRRLAARDRQLAADLRLNLGKNQNKQF
jgi:hypothetical protein